MRDIIQTHYKQHVTNNTLDEFRNNFCINDALCKMRGHNYNDTTLNDNIDC